MPFRIHASSSAQNLSNLRCATDSAASWLAFCSLPGREVAWKRIEPAAVELDDARREAVEERAVVGDDDRRRLAREQVLQAHDAVDVEMVRRLVQQDQIWILRERKRERGALGLASGKRVGVRLRIEREAIEERFEAMLGDLRLPQ
jgi:hypothetical protein